MSFTLRRDDRLEQLFAGYFGKDRRCDDSEHLVESYVQDTRNSERLREVVEDLRWLSMLEHHALISRLQRYGADQKYHGAKARGWIDRLRLQIEARLDEFEGGY